MRKKREKFSTDAREYASSARWNFRLLLYSQPAMHLHAVAFLLTVWATLSYAIHESDVGVVDWHKRLIGVSNVESSHTAPIFHRIHQEDKNTRSVVITATRSNVLAALDPVNGSVAWRFVYQPRDRIVTFEKRGSGTSFRAIDVACKLNTWICSCIKSLRHWLSDFEIIRRVERGLVARKTPA